MTEVRGPDMAALGDFVEEDFASVLGGGPAVKADGGRIAGGVGFQFGDVGFFEGKVHDPEGHDLIRAKVGAPAVLVFRVTFPESDFVLGPVDFHDGDTVFWGQKLRP